MLDGLGLFLGVFLVGGAPVDFDGQFVFGTEFLGGVNGTDAAATVAARVSSGAGVTGGY